MLFSLITLALTATATAKTHIVWEHAKSSTKTSLSVYNDHTLLARTCSSVISSASNSIDFSDVDVNGFGNFTIGNSKYLVHSKVEFSGGPICTNKYNHEATVVECSGVEWTPGSNVKIEDDCHEKDDAIHSLDFMNSKRSIRGSEVMPAAVQKREASPGPDCNIVTRTSMIGDGNPHQNYYLKQLSQIQRCGAADSCTVGYGTTWSITVGWTANAAAAGWISGGFAVSQSWGDSSSYSCGGRRGDEICIWYNTAHTAYTVHNMFRDTCSVGNGWEPNSGSFVMFSPNNQNRGGGFYCVVGTCRAQGDAYWDYNGRAGGP
ncbi:hypothetical protein FHETE_5203 [Fusarium heterosporum]|uniref:Uncharacterized protein n=1 Tax=Fusarium heterosporum TaxID=42747 RepID=A0A8H5TFK0_FUSHE|nr:hypothetical protein FHETE_5203 [Fusarium heterosporum]